MKASVEIRNEVKVKVPDGGGWKLCFQRVIYHYDDGSTEDGYRFICRRPDGSLQAARGQARIPDAVTHDRLIRAAKSEGWFE
jgi:hypothetical protein